ncbi:MAG: PhzF family phenazine biosynthesis protein [Candidatus Krumholzibacteria bacterium]|nr:PhzF family phenazine biosynthesis protein [Candidatus Krumholzibacteria bacterium]
MRQFIIKQVDAFTTKPFSGNPAGVVTDADGLSVEMMQRIASEMNLTENAFVSLSDSEDARFQIKFFTPSNELDLSVHAIIAACFALIEDGVIKLDDEIKRVCFETNAGNIPVNIYFDKNHTSEISDNDRNRVVLTVDGKKIGALKKIMTQKSIQRYSPADVTVKEIAGILGIDESEILGTGLPLELISSGLSQFIIPVNNKESIINMHPDMIKLNLMNRKYGIQTNDIFTLDSINPDCIAYSRHFSPAIGLWEETGSGAAAASIGTYLFRHGVITSGSVVMEQGGEIENLARILVEIDQAGGETGSVWTGGLAVTSITRELDIENDEILIT